MSKADMFKKEKKVSRMKLLPMGHPSLFTIAMACDGKDQSEKNAYKREPSMVPIMKLNKAMESSKSDPDITHLFTDVGTIDGVRREIFNEVEGEGMNAPDNIPNPSDPWSAYDDNTVIDTEDG
ncbi:hypothetical protein GCK32_018908 [Trichostrongylus colubriformis]|uniref:Uncharacterized protein n=1 Tax=Trichostrongylus colubriformis TaxID=6319 RepID=A0AAN8EYX2_TRICO